MHKRGKINLKLFVYVAFFLIVGLIFVIAPGQLEVPGTGGGGAETSVCGNNVCETGEDSVSCPSDCCPRLSPPLQKEGCTYTPKYDENKCIVGYDEKCTSCPQFSPPAPDWCKDGKIISGGVDENGCQLTPECVPIKCSDYSLQECLSHDNCQIVISRKNQQRCVEKPKECKIGGCSGTLCGEPSLVDNVDTTCEVKPEYSCYKDFGKCEKQTDGKCGWAPTEELVSCLKSRRALCGNNICESNENPTNCPQDCSTRKCSIPECAAPPEGCHYEEGTDENGCPTCGKLVCEYSCDRLLESQASYFNSCKAQGYDKVCFNKNTGVYQGCGKSSYNDCTINNVNTAQNVWCDITSVCGNNICETGEDSTNCPADCKKEIKCTDLTPEECVKYDNCELIKSRKQGQRCVEKLKPSITITSPNGGEIWQVGSTAVIQWQSKGIPSTSSIDIIRLRDSSGVEKDIVSQTENDGIEKIIVPDYLEAGSYKLEIKTSLNGGTVFDESDAEFNIVIKEPEQKDDVTCVFQGSTTQQKCYTAIDPVGSSIGYECGGIESCSVIVQGKYGGQVTWKSSCGGYAYTTIDGIGEKAVFNCKTKQTCTDSDGKDIYVKGYVTFGSGEVEGKLEDYCVDERNVNEGLCNPDGTSFFVTYGCENGCKDGACLQSQQKCGTDTDCPQGTCSDGTTYSKYSCLSGFCAPINYAIDPCVKAECKTDADCPQIDCIRAPCPQTICVNGRCVTSTCGDGICDSTENPTNCPSDCKKESIINVISAIYAVNCGAPTKVSKIADACNGKTKCDYTFNYVTDVGYDPAYGCAKDLKVEYACSGQDGSKSVYVAGEAGVNSKIALSCGAKQQCTDSDGKDIYTKGIAKSITGGQSIEITDYCSDESHVNEGVCQGDGTVGTINYLCENGCREGVCSKEKQYVCGNGICESTEENPTNCPQDCANPPEYP